MNWWRKKEDLTGKTVWIVGGSKGLGKEIAKILASQGANVTIFARSPLALKEARLEILEARRVATQVVKAVAADMSLSSSVNKIVNAQSALPDILYLVAGGTPTECGFIPEVSDEAVERCMRNNYFTSFYPAQVIFRRWIEDDANEEERRKDGDGKARERKIAFVNSTAGLVNIPGYGAYSATKAAQRSLAETLRLEASRYSSPVSKYSIHIAFPHNFISDSFISENQHKPDLTKKIEGTEGSQAELENKFPGAGEIAREIVGGVEGGEFAVVDKRWDAQLLWGGAKGFAPGRGWGAWDFLGGWLVALLIGPVVRWGWEGECVRDGKRMIGLKTTKVEDDGGL